jgi:hypothetical protein
MSAPTSPSGKNGGERTQRPGKRDSAGRWVGTLFSALAFATFLRMGAMVAGLQRDPQWTGWLQWAPTVCWLIAGLLLLYVGVVHLRRWMAEARPT